MTPGPAPAEEGGEAVKPDAGAPVKLVVWYFHGTIRCVTCLDIEREARRQVFQSFLSPMSEGLLEWRSVNYDVDPGASLAKSFKLSLPSLLLTQESADGKVMASKNLDRIWELAEDPEKLREYVREEVTAMLGPVRPPAPPAH